MGRRIQKGWDEIPLNVGGSIVNIKMNMAVETCDGFSGHSDRRQLLNFINNMSMEKRREKKYQKINLSMIMHSPGAGYSI